MHAVLKEGQSFERYTIQQRLSNSVSGTSYEAEDTFQLRKVILKLLHPWAPLTDAARRQFFREMQGIGALTHPYLAAILDYGEVDGQLYVVRRYVTPGTLLGSEGRFWYRPPLELTAALDYTHQLAVALQYVHDNGYVHGALTFSNILVISGPGVERTSTVAPFLIADVGTSHFVRRFGRPQITLLPITAAPEQFGKHSTAASDQYALAILLYFWLTGRPPFLGTPEEIEHLKLTETITTLTALNLKVPLEVEGVIRRALSVYPEDRYPSVLEFTHALQASMASSIKTSALYAMTTETVDPIQLESRPAPSNGYVAETLLPEREQTTHNEPLAQLDPLSQTIPASLPSTPLPEATNLAKLEPAMVAEPELTIVAEPALVAESESTLIDESEPAMVAEPELTIVAEPALVAESESTLIDESEPAMIAEPELAIVAEPAFIDEPEPTMVTKTEPLSQAILDIPLPPSTPLPGFLAEAEPDSAPASDFLATLPKPTTIPLTPQIQDNSVQSYQKAELTSPKVQSTSLASVLITSPYLEQPQEIALEQTETTLGRAGSSDILLDQDTLVSRHHALLRYEDDHYVIYDQRSANGVFVNGEKIPVNTAYALKDDDHIIIGEHELIFSFKHPDAPDAVPEHVLYQS